MLDGISKSYLLPYVPKVTQLRLQAAARLMEIELADWPNLFVDRFRDALKWQTYCYVSFVVVRCFPMCRLMKSLVGGGALLRGGPFLYRA